ncbi:D-galactate dehydratase/Altronate hydrolase [Clostridioides difficile]|nr:D-galactate dehydratase/Altronate hydrolase [Clostridioides difficile]
MDFDASPVIYGPQTMEELTEDLLNMVVDVANGKQSKAESLGYTEMAIARVCNYV